MTRFVCLAVIVLGQWPLTGSGQQSQSPAADRLARQQADLAALEARAGVYEVAIDYSYRLANGEQYGKKTNYTVTRKPGHIRIRADDDRMVFCSNPTYMFVAAKPKSGGYVLAQYRAGTEYGSASVRENEFNRFVRSYHLVSHPLTECVDTSYPEAVRSGRLKVTAVESDADGVRVQYTRTLPDPAGKLTVTATGTLTFDMAGHLSRQSERAAGGWKMDRQRAHAATLAGGTPFTDSDVLDTFSGGVATVTRTTIKPLSDPPAGDHEFYLTHYGLPEPSGGGAAPAGPVPYWWWFAGASALAALAAAFHRLARGRTDRATRPAAIAPPSAGG